MQKKVLLIITCSVVAVIGIFIACKILTASVKPSANSAAGVPARMEKASKEEAELFELASRYEQSGDLLNVRDTYQKIIEEFPGSDNIQKAQEGLEGTNVRILFSPIATPDSLSYEIQKGDTLAKIAKKFSNTQDMILKANNLKNPKVVPLGRKIKVHNEKFSIVVDKSQNILTLKSGDRIVKTYRVSTGLNNSTPVGNFKIINKIVDPPWYTAGSVIPADSPKNILGSRWLGISAQSYGIHGTTEPQSIGKQVTSGCVRMINSEVEELYQIVPEGTEVVIVD
ncbi:MAG: L,D-transpeptidase family protein [Candidatus Omnitrophota bacterium]|nr:L,D-transpeptidase family protein [Candidatus Omnitrophota bacterium]